MSVGEMFHKMSNHGNHSIKSKLTTKLSEFISQQIKKKSKKVKQNLIKFVYCNIENPQIYRSTLFKMPSM